MVISANQIELVAVSFGKVLGIFREKNVMKC